MLATSVPIKRSVVSGKSQWTDHLAPTGRITFRVGNLAIDDDIQPLLQKSYEPVVGEATRWWTDPMASWKTSLTSVPWTTNWPYTLAVREAAGIWLQQTQPSPMALVESVLEQFAWILGLPDNWDDEGAPPYERTTWDRMKEFLLDSARDYRRYAARNIPLPTIDPGDKASIDLFWQLSARRLLANVPADPNKPITFFGKDQSGVSISGKIGRSEDADPEHHRKAVSYLTAWLATRG